MDDDDFSYPDRLQTQLEFLGRNPEYAFVSSLSIIFDGKNLYELTKKNVEKPEREDFLWTSCFLHPATMFRAQALKSVNGYRVAKETYKSQDYDLFMRMYAKGMKGYNIQKPLLRYFMDPEAARKKLRYKYKINEAIIRYKGFKSLRLLPRGWPYIVKPLLVGLIPVKLLVKIKR